MEKLDLYQRDTSHLTFRKSAKSASASGCVAVAIDPTDGAVFVRDDKNPDRPAHAFTAHEWACFLDGAKNGEFDL